MKYVNSAKYKILLLLISVPHLCIWTLLLPQWSSSADNPLSKCHTGSCGAGAPWRISISPGRCWEDRLQQAQSLHSSDFELRCTQKDNGDVLSPELRVTSWPETSVQEWSLRTGTGSLSWHSPAAALLNLSCASWAPPYGQASLLKGSWRVIHNHISVHTSFGNFTSIFENK